MKRIFQFSHCTLHLYRKKIILFSVLSIGSSLISLFNTLLSGRFIDFLASPNCVEWKPQLCYYCILFLATIMISFAISFALGRIREKLHTMVSYNINRQMLVHIQQIPFSKTFFLDSSRITQQLQTDSNEIASYCISSEAVLSQQRHWCQLKASTTLHIHTIFMMLEPISTVVLVAISE